MATQDPTRARAAARFVVALLRNGTEGPPELPAELDWTDALRACVRHGLTLRLAEALERTSPPLGLPDAVAARLTTLKAEAIRKHLSALATVSTIGAALDPLEVPWAIVKGPALAADLCGERVCRSFDDVDLLVPRQHRESCIAALVGAGFRASGGALLQAFTARVHFHQVLTPPAGRSKVELHWALVDGVNLFRIDEDAALAGRRTVTAGGLAIPTLDPEATLLYVCLHLDRHGLFNRTALERGTPAHWFASPESGNRLKWFQDVHALIERHGPSLRWQEARALAERWNITEELRSALAATEGVFDDGVAAGAMAHLGLAEVPRLASTDNEQMSVAPGWGQRAHAQLVIRPIRLRGLLRVLVPAPSRLMRYHGASARTLPWLYLRHPAHMLSKVLGRLPS